MTDIEAQELREKTLITAMRRYLLWAQLGRQKWWREYITFCKEHEINPDAVQVHCDDAIAEIYNAPRPAMSEVHWEGEVEEGFPNV